MEIKKPNRFNLILGEYFNDVMHGHDDESDKHIYEHYLVIERFNLNKKDSKEYIKDVIQLHKLKYATLCINQLDQQHPIIYNYKNMIKKKDYVQLHIGECFYLSGGECVAVIKTFWIKIIQRIWKRVFRQKQEENRFRRIYDTTI